MKKQKLIEELEKIIGDLKNSPSDDDIIIWAYDHYGSCHEGGAWIVMDGKFELNKNQLDIK